MVSQVRRRGRKSGGEIAYDLTENNVGRRDVESVGTVVKLVFFDGVCEGWKVWEIVCEVG